MRLLLICLIWLIPSVCLGVTAVTRHDITWNFADDETCGTFANGDPWCVGPVTIETISPLSTNVAGRIQHGSMLNPTEAQNGYDSSMDYSPYNAFYNVGRPGGNDMTSSNPLVVYPGNSLVSSKTTIETINPLDRPTLLDASVLTILSGPSPGTYFRPPYSGTDKTLNWNTADIHWWLLPGLAKSGISNLPTISTLETQTERLWLDHGGGVWTGRYFHPANNMPDYGADISVITGDVALAFTLDYTEAELTTLMIQYLQIGIDLYGVTDNVVDIITTTSQGGLWMGGGGHGHGRKWPMMFAGFMLDDANITAYTDPDNYLIFQEEQQHFYVTQADVDQAHYDYEGTHDSASGNDTLSDSTASFPDLVDDWVLNETDGFSKCKITANSSTTITCTLAGGTENDWDTDDIYLIVYDGKRRDPYVSGDIGMAEWGESHQESPQRDGSNLDASYRGTVGASLRGSVLAANIMGKTNEWNWPSIFEYYDNRWTLANETTYGNYSYDSPFAAEMWDSYRSTFVATTYYIDFDAGSDSANGTTSSTPWKHAPGDLNATSISAGTTLVPGDTLIFKGGVVYRGTIENGSSGSAGLPITYDGNTAGTFGTGMAILDGSELVETWTACASQVACGGNPLWADMYTAIVPDGIRAVDANMYQDDEILWPAQSPNLTDEFYADDLDTYHTVVSANVTLSDVTDSAVFTSSDSNYYDGSYIRLWGLPNKVRILPITDFVPAEDKIKFANTGPNSVYPEGTYDTIPYAIANHIMDIDVRGEFSLNETTNTVYLYPLNDGDPDLQEVTISTRGKGLNLKGYSYITVQGFKAQKYTGGLNGYFNGCGIITRLGGTNLTIQDNETTMNYSHENEGSIRVTGGNEDRGLQENILIDNNSIYENPHNVGIMVGALNNSVISNNTLRKNGGTAVDLYGATNSGVTNNYVYDNLGGHANGITLYLGCDNIFVGYNKVVDGNVALTTQDASNITVAYNIFQTSEDTYTIADWSKSTRISDKMHYYNNVIINAYNKAMLIGEFTLNAVIKNNIVDGLPGWKWVTDLSHNIYTSLSSFQSTEYLDLQGEPWALQEGEQIVFDTSLIFTDYANRDFTLKADSPAIDAGTFVNLTEDFLGKTVPVNLIPEIGAYERGGFYLDSGASGTNDGSSWENAWESFADIDSSWGAGDTLYISGGTTTSNKTYLLDSTFTFPSGTDGHPVILKLDVNDPDHNGTAVIDGQDTVGNLFDLKNSDYFVIDGEVLGNRRMRFQNWGTVNVGTKSFNGYSALSGYGTNNTLEGITIRYIDVINDDITCPATDGCRYDNVSTSVNYENYNFEFKRCMYLSDTSGGSLIEYNYLEGCTKEAIVTGASGYDNYEETIIQYNEIKGYRTDGTLLLGGLADGSLPYDTVAYDTPPSAGASYGGPDGIKGGGNSTIRYNTIYHEALAGAIWNPLHIAEDGIQITPGSEYIKIYNNTLYGYSQGPIRTDPSPTLTTDHIHIYNNLLYSAFTGGQQRGIELGGQEETGFTDIKIYNNTIAGFGTRGIHVSADSATTTDVEIYNNILYDSRLLISDYTGSGLVVDYNLVINADGTQGTNDYGNQIHDPYDATDTFDFVAYTVPTSLTNTTGDDFHLGSLNDPTIGTPLTEYFTDDIEGIDREGVFDLGAYKSGVAAYTGLDNLPDSTVDRFPITDRTWPSSFGDAEITLWKDDKMVAVSQGIDDNWVSEHDFWIDVGNTYGHKFTWWTIVYPLMLDYDETIGTSTGFFGTMEDFKLLFDLGHDVQAHGSGVANDMDEAGYTHDLQFTKDMLEKYIPGNEVIMYAYPSGDFADFRKTVAGSIFNGARGTVGGGNHANNIQYLSSRGSPLDIDLLEFMIDDPSHKNYRGWMDRYDHGVAATKDTEAVAAAKYQAVRDKYARMADMEEDIWFDVYRNISRFGQERDSHVLTNTLNTATELRYTLTDDMNDDIFTVPLTMKVKLDATWNSVSATQGSIGRDVEFVTNSGSTYALVDVVPDQGTIILTKTGDATGVSDGHVTWIFDSEYVVGQFVTGDWWVVDPGSGVTITSIYNDHHVGVDLSTVDYDGTMEEINRGSTRTGDQGWMVDCDTKISGYTSDLNLSHNLPATISSGTTISTAVSWLIGDEGRPNLNGNCPRPSVKQMALLTVVGSVPASGSFRPSYSRGTKTIYNTSNVKYNILPAYEQPDSAPSVYSLERLFDKPWVDPTHEWQSEFLRGTDNYPTGLYYGNSVLGTYNRDVSRMYGDAILLALTDTPESKTGLVNKLIQVGIDYYGLLLDGATWPSNGGHQQGYKLPILFAGKMLGVQTMLDIGDLAVNDASGTAYFQEDGDTGLVEASWFYPTTEFCGRGNTWSQSNADNDIDYPDYPDAGTAIGGCVEFDPDAQYNFIDHPVGTPEWGIRYSFDLDQNDANPLAAYRGNNATSIAGHVLAARLLDLKDNWDHDPLFDYLDRWVSWSGDEMEAKYIFGSAFSEDMWTLYREYSPPPVEPPQDFIIGDLGQGWSIVGGGFHSGSGSSAVSTSLIVDGINALVDGTNAIIH